MKSLKDGEGDAYNLRCGKRSKKEGICIVFPQQKLQFKGSLSKRLKSVDVKCQKKVDLPDKRGNRREYALFF